MAVRWTCSGWLVAASGRRKPGFCDSSWSARVRSGTANGWNRDCRQTVMMALAVARWPAG